MLRPAVRGLLVVAFLACGGDGNGSPTAPRVPSIAGVWNFSETFTDQVHSISCSNQGTFNISQSGSTFTGTFSQTGVCTGPGGSFDNSGSGNISGGQISGQTVSFQVPFCQYQGTLSGDPPHRMSGTVSCSFQEAGETFNFAGNWQASR